MNLFWWCVIYAYAGVGILGFFYANIHTIRGLKEGSLTWRHDKWAILLVPFICLLIWPLVLGVWIHEVGRGKGWWSKLGMWYYRKKNRFFHYLPMPARILRIMIWKHLNPSYVVEKTKRKT